MISFFYIVALDDLLNVLRYKTVGQVGLLRQSSIEREEKEERQDLVFENIAKYLGVTKLKICTVPIKMLEELLFLLVIFSILRFQHLVAAFLCLV